MFEEQCRNPTNMSTPAFEILAGILGSFLQLPLLALAHTHALHQNNMH